MEDVVNWTINMMVRGILTKKHPPPFSRKLRTMGTVCGEIGVARTSAYLYDDLKHSNWSYNFHASLPRQNRHSSSGGDNMIASKFSIIPRIAENHC